MSIEQLRVLKNLGVYAQILRCRRHEHQVQLASHHSMMWIHVKICINGMECRHFFPYKNECMDTCLPFTNKVYIANAQLMCVRRFVVSTSFVSFYDQLISLHNMGLSSLYWLTYSSAVTSRFLNSEVTTSYQELWWHADSKMQRMRQRSVH